jgi:hypothetical protein
MRPTLTLIAALVLTGCAGAEPAAEPSTSTVTTTATVTATETATVTVTPKPTASASTSDPTDLTARLQGAGEVWSDKVLKVRKTGARSYEVTTTVVDPRGRDGSPAATEALAICRATLAAAKDDDVDSPTVRVLEADGTTFAHGGIDGPGCVEY